MADAQDLDTGQIREWRSILTLVVFVLTNLVILFPFNIPVPIPLLVWKGFTRILVRSRIIAPPGGSAEHHHASFKWHRFPVNFNTAPLAANLLLLMTTAIGRREVHDGTVGANSIVPYDIMIFFVCLAYIAISIDVSGLIRWLAYKVLQKAGDGGHKLFFYLYAFFFSLGSFIGNDPIILSGTPFLAYMTRVSENIEVPTAWIYTQFAISNIASAILVSSNPTNLVLAGAFGIKFLNYTANIIVPVVITVFCLFPFLMYVVFRSEAMIPSSIKLHELSEDAKARLHTQPVNPNIPYARGALAEQDATESSSTGPAMPLEEILHPYLDKSGAIFSSVVMAATLICILALNASASSTHEYPVFWVTLPASAITFGYDIVSGWVRRKQTREIARKGLTEVQEARARAVVRAEMSVEIFEESDVNQHDPSACNAPRNLQLANETEKMVKGDYVRRVKELLTAMGKPQPTTLHSQIRDSWNWCQETFPTAAAVIKLLPLPLVPFAFCMFVLVQALVTKGWVPVFAHGWNAWVKKTGTVGSIAGMGFLGTLLSNFAGTNIGTTILLSRVIQAWQEITHNEGGTITDRTFWGAVYSMAIAVNYGAFSGAFSGSLAGMLWRDILARRHIHVRSRDFALINLPIIAFTMVVGLVALTAEIYIMRDDTPYDA